MIENIVFYHKNCEDGMAAAAVAYKAMGDLAIYIPAQYGDDLIGLFRYHERASNEIFNFALVRNIYFVDFSPSEEFLDNASIASRKVFVIDHHVNTEVKDLKDRVDEYVFDVNKSGCVLAFEFFFPDEKVPYLLEILQDRDLWTFKLPETKAITAAHRFTRGTFSDLIELFDEKKVQGFLEEKLPIAKFMLADKDAQATSYAAKSVVVPFDGYMVGVMNTGHLISETGNKIASNPDIDFSMTYFIETDGTVVFSLRSTGFDVGSVAQSKGGGGHKQAAGFRADLFFLSNLLNGKL